MGTYMKDVKEVIYRYDTVLRNMVERINKNESISPKNKELILEYRDNCIARGLSKARQVIILQALLRVGTAAKVDFDKAERKDVERIMADLQSRGYSNWTIETLKSVMKAFWRWMYKLEQTDTLPDCIKWVRRSTPPSKISKSDLLTKEEICKMIKTTTDLMQKALITVHFESCNRPGETLQMKIGSVKFEKDYALIRVSGKTEKKTGISEKFLLQSYDLLRSWIESHPFKEDPNYPLWIVTSHMRVNRGGADLFGKPISLTYLGIILKNAAKKAGIKKRVYSYLCRHSRGTELYGSIGEALAKKQMSHAPDSKMAKFYNHLNSEDLLIGLKKANGLQEENEEEKHPEICWKCHHPNGFGAKICSRCASPLSIQAAIEKKQEESEREERLMVLERAFLEIEKKPELLEMLRQKLPNVGVVK